MANSKAAQTGIAISKFIFWARALTPQPEGAYIFLDALEIEGAQAAAERIVRQLEAAREAGRIGGKATGRATGRNGGRRPVSDPSSATLAKRKSRARKA